ncbi:MAG TPA: N-acetylneuraminate synthase family protein [Candidatus Hydrogenedentes bacterium]|nr:N-acetylneuraminate synthase family protein [Candidatus Hydrogenedentota bacterium]
MNSSSNETNTPLKGFPAPYLIAEIGCNHCGEFERARELIRMAAVFCQVPAVKFQKRTPHEVLSPEEYAKPHPEPRQSYGDTYGAHREFLEFTPDQHQQLREYCHEMGLAYSCSVWDMTSARDIAGIAPNFIKVPSACNTHFEMAAYLCDNFQGDIHVSLGMSTVREIEAIVQFYKDRGRAHNVVLYHCTSGYPISFDDVNLLEIPHLAALYGSDVKAIGFSGHHLGISVDIAAYALGASYFERHFTLDRTLKGTDHAASLEPDGLRRVWRDLQATARALHRKPQDILPVEEPQRAKLKWDRAK